MITTSLGKVMRLNQMMAQRIRKARRAAGLKARDLASYLNMSPLFISHLESGRYTITDDLIKKIAKVTAQPISFFYSQNSTTSKSNFQKPQISKPLDTLFAKATKQEPYYTKCREFAEKIQEHERKEHIP